MNSNNEINYETKNSIKAKLDYKDAKVKVSMFLDGDLLLAIKDNAKSTNQKYQTLINKILRGIFLQEHTTVKPEDYAELKKRVEILERAFLKKTA